MLATNRKAHFRFVILETCEAGVILTGSEAKSAKTGNINLSDAYAIFKNDECWLMNCHIAPYTFDASAMRNPGDPTRTRKLLLHKQEIDRISGKMRAKGFTLVPLDVYVSDRSVVKITLALAKGKKGPDRKEDIKKKDIERELARDYKLR